MANMFDGATGWSVSDPLTGSTIGGGTFDAQNGGASFAQRFSLPDATIASSGWSSLTAQTPGAAPNPVAQLAGLNWPSAGAVGVPAGTSNAPSGSSDWQSWIGARGVVMLLGLIFVGGGVTMFRR